MLSSLCKLCRTPTRYRCSLCKSVYYCTLECQGKHWKQGHRVECPRTDVKNAPQKKEHALCASDGTLAKPKKVLFPYKNFVEFFNLEIDKIPCGLINCGNSCYANVVLQCLAFTRPLAAYLQHGLHQETCQREDWCFMCELEEHIRKAYTNQYMPLSPIKILSRLRSIGNSLGYGRQEDAHEFMRLAVECMQRICLDEAGGETSLDARTQETTLIQHIFGGYLQSQVICCECQQVSNLYENMLDLSVGIQGDVESLEDALKQFTSPEWLDGENKYRCDRCNGYVRAKKRLAIHEAPNILTIALKRFQGGKFGKINKKVTYPEELDMAPYMSGKVDTPPVYSLYAVVVHVDMLNSSYFGHYVCYVQSSNRTWYKVDDSKVKEVEQERVMSQKAYMLFYSRSVPRPGPVVEKSATGTPSMASASDSAVSNRENITRTETNSRNNPSTNSSAANQVLESSDSSIESGFPKHGTQKTGKRTWLRGNLHNQTSSAVSRRVPVTEGESLRGESTTTVAPERSIHNEPVSTRTPRTSISIRIPRTGSYSRVPRTSSFHEKYTEQVPVSYYESDTENGDTENGDGMRSSITSEGNVDMSTENPKRPRTLLHEESDADEELIYMPATSSAGVVSESFRLPGLHGQG